MRGISLLNSETEHILEKCQQLRLQSRFQEAAQTLGPIVNTNTQSTVVLLETLKLVVLIKDVAQVKMFHDMLTALEGGSEIISASLKQRVSDVLAQNDSPENLHDFEIEKVELSAESGVTYFVFIGSCPECQLHSNIPLSMTFFIDKHFPCAQCFTTLRLHGKQIVKFIKEERSDLMSHKYVALDEKMVALQDKIGDYNNEHLPFIIRAQNQNFTSYFSELVFKRLSGSE
jgi:hypothetical protein